MVRTALPNSEMKVSRSLSLHRAQGTSTHEPPTHLTVTVLSPMVRLTTRPSVQVVGVPDPPELDPPVLPLDPELEEPELLDDPEFDPLGLLLDPRLEDELELDEVEPEPLLDWLRWAWAWAAAAASASACLVAL